MAEIIQFVTASKSLPRRADAREQQAIAFSNVALLGLPLPDTSPCEMNPYHAPDNDCA